MVFVDLREFASPFAKIRGIAPRSKKPGEVCWQFIVRRPVGESHFGGLSRQGGWRMFHGFWGVRCGLEVLQEGSCSPNFVFQTKWGSVASTMFLHCFLFVFCTMGSAQLDSVWKYMWCGKPPPPHLCGVKFAPVEQGQRFFESCSHLLDLLYQKNPTWTCLSVDIPRWAWRQFHTERHNQHWNIRKSMGP